MKMEALLNEHSNLRKQILNYFEYEEYCHIFPIINLTDVYWAYDGPHLIYCDEQLTNEVIKSGRQVEASYYWTDENDHKYETLEYTLFVLKSHLNAVPTLSIFSNSRKMDLEVTV